MAKFKYQFDQDGRILLIPKPGTFLSRIVAKSQEILGGGIAEEDLHDTIFGQYKSYVGSRLVGRDIPLGIDGLNYSMRRILYSVKELGLLPGKPKMKLNTVIGEVMKIHAHGSGSVHKTAARMGRRSDMMLPLFNCEGNFGSAYTKRPSADRYLSINLSKFAYYCFFKDSKVINEIYDTRLAPTFKEEPVFLPTRYPYTLLEWNQGICAGVATQLPAFNITELLEATIKLVDDPHAKVEIYPDTPVEVNITNKRDLKHCFDMHSFHVRMESVWTTTIVQDYDARGKIYDKYYIAITSVPVGVTPISIKETLTKIKKEDAEKNNPIKRFDEILDISEDSCIDPTKFDLFIEYKKGTDPNALMEKIYKATGARKTVAVMCTVIHEQNPVDMTPRELVNLWIDERITILTDWIRQNYTKNMFEAIKREAFIIIKRSMTEYVKFVESSKLEDEALIQAVADKFGLSRPQADYVLNQKFKTISKSNVHKLEEEMNAFKKEADFYHSKTSIKAIKEIIKDQLREGIQLFGQPRSAILYTKKEKEEVVASNTRYLIYNRDVYYCVDSKEAVTEITAGLDYSYRVLMIDDAEMYMVFSTNGSMKNVRGIDFTTSTMAIDHRVHVSIARILPVSAGKTVTLVTATGICKSLDVKSIDKGVGSKVIKLADKDFLVDAVTTKKKGALAVLADDRMYYTDMANIPDQKKGSAGNNVFKDIKKPIVRSAHFIPNAASAIVLCCESGYVKVMDNSLPGRNKTSHYVSAQGKEIVGVLAKEGESAEQFELISNNGVEDIVIGINETKVSFTGDKLAKTVPIGSSISQTVKVFRFNKNEYYEII